MYVIYEYEGKSLSDVYPLPAQEASSILFQVCGTALLQHRLECTSHLLDVHRYKIVQTIYYLVRSGIAFRMREVRVTADGRAKLSQFLSNNQTRISI